MQQCEATVAITMGWSIGEDGKIDFPKIVVGGNFGEQTFSSLG